MARSTREPSPQLRDPLDALAAAADALYSAADGAADPHDALRRAEEAVRRIARAPDRQPELDRASWDIARARARLAAGLVAETREIANRLYESAIVMLEATRPAAAIHPMLLRVLLRRTLAASGDGSEAAAERAILFARAAARALALDAGPGASPLHRALERLVADGHAAALSHRGAAVHDATRQALRVLDALDAERAQDRDGPATSGSDPRSR